jgi:hypothetical protein
LYDRARDGLVDFLADGTRNYKHLANAVDSLAKRHDKMGATDWVKRDSRYSIEAIEAFQGGYNKLGLPKLDCRPVNGRLPSLQLGPTKISVDIDLTVHKPTKGGSDKVGGIMLLFSRGEKLVAARIEQCKTIAGLIYVFGLNHLKGFGEPDRALCLAVDVFAQRMFNPPGTFRKNLAYIEDASEEIATRWKNIPPPDDYDGPEPS